MPASPTCSVPLPITRTGRRRRRRWPAPFVAGALVVAGALFPGAGTPVAAAAAPAAAASTPGRYVPVTPTRLLDTRSQGGALGEGGLRSIDLERSVPGTATAVVLNVTATEPTADGFLTVFPGYSPRPLASSLNKRAGETRANSVTVALPDGGLPHTVDVYNQAGRTQVVVDLPGYYDTATGSGYYSLEQPERVYDSRPDETPGGDVQRLAPGQGDNLYLYLPDDISEVTAVAVNVTAVDALGGGFLTTWNGRGDQPGTSTVNYGFDPVTPNFAIVPTWTFGETFSFSFRNNSSSVNVVVDVVGFYGTPGAAGATAYRPVPPLRLGDTRNSGILGQDQAYDTPVPEADAVAANLNVTAVDARQLTYLTVYASDVDRPYASNLNPPPGKVVANAVQTQLGGGGLYRVYNALGFVDVVADLEGYFVADEDAPGAAPRSVAVARTVARAGSAD